MSATEVGQKPRLLFLGSGKVGKTSIIRRLIDSSFDAKYQPTVEDVHQCRVVARGQSMDLEFVDTSGSHSFPAMLQIWMRSATAIVFVFAQNDTYSWEHLKGLMNQFFETRTASERASIPIVVACNKCDLLITELCFSDGSIESWMADCNLKSSQFLYTSANTNTNVLCLFERLWQQNVDCGAIQTQPLEIQGDVIASAQPELASGLRLTVRSSSPPANSRSSLDPSNSNKSGLFRSRFGSSIRRSKTPKNTREKNKLIQPECTIC